ncbi:cysteine--tRNA ligase [Mesorhizobium australicum]|uniref:Cysteine--tRNA ligase n=1 Tax=Mesorhizobium australicum TaxID=536018 RepID=A0A1X7NZN7_9HYPH|nr:cysteine--tRNA ligase [Mesorhizobium australicum]SMH43784.1 cysteinyl-tRNA synthetase [Mesorhizobium australicum]
MSEGFKGLRLYNTLTRTKEDFVPIDAARVRMYVCGPTVYDYAHIGNARPAIVFDVLYRLLRHLYGADHVTYVRNITDVDDKINARALRDYGAEIETGRLTLNETIRKVTEPTYEQYQKDVTALGCLPPTFQPRATEFVLPRADGKSDMATLIQSLIDRGHAYVSNGEVLFDVASMADYGQLSKRPLDEQQAGARIAVDAHKKNPADFVLWKESSADEPGWEASFRISDDNRRALDLPSNTVAIRGRPGWHIECSAMSAAYLGEVFDIHGGGLDLIFPHHENEIAQSRCAHGTEVMANYWLHNGFLQVEGKKMSKSDGNFVTIHELLETEKFGGRTWPGEVLRLAMLMTHYREPIDFSVRRLEEAEHRLTGWQRAADAGVDADLPDALVNEISDDLSFAKAAIELDNLARRANRGDTIAGHQLAHALVWLGFTPYGLLAQRETDLTATRAAVDRRLAFIRDKNWAEADRIRDELLAQGIQLKDGKDPATGERVTTWEVKR